MSELKILRHEDRVYYSMDEIEVDGIRSKKNKPDGNYFFSLKTDVSDFEDSDAEYLDNENQTVFWSSPHTVWEEASYEYGEVDEELWLKRGYIIAENYPRKDDFIFD